MKTVILTGCSKGIGNSILTRLLNSNDFRVYAITKHTDSLMDITSPILSVYQCDFSNIDSVIELLTNLNTSIRTIDILINNAGVGVFDKIENISIEDWMDVLNINLTTPFLFIKTFLPKMKELNSGKIINISSDADYLSFSGAGLYCATKFGLRGLSESIRKELTGTNISITTLGPGRVDTYFNNKKPGDRPTALVPDVVADQVMHIINQPLGCGIERMYLSSTLE